jgi:hypothetical protein
MERLRYSSSQQPPDAYSTTAAALETNHGFTAAVKMMVANSSSPEKFKRLADELVDSYAEAKEHGLDKRTPTFLGDQEALKSAEPSRVHVRHSRDEARAPTSMQPSSFSKPEQPPPAPHLQSALHLQAAPLQQTSFLSGRPGFNWMVQTGGGSAQVSRSAHVGGSGDAPPLPPSEDEQENIVAEMFGIVPHQHRQGTSNDGTAAVGGAGAEGEEEDESPWLTPAWATSSVAV